MITKELIDYVAQQRALGKSDVEIKQSLAVEGGWTKIDIDQLFGAQKTKNTKVVLVVSSAIFVVVVTGLYFILQNGWSGVTPAVQISNSAKNRIFDDSDLKISSTRIAPSENSVSVFNAIKSGAIAKADQDFLTKYFSKYSSKNLPPVAESQKIVTKYSALLSMFNAQANKQYQCLFSSGDACLLQSIRDIAYIAALQSLTLYQQNKMSQAQSTALNIVSLGKGISAYSDSVITLLIGWQVQSLGYNVLSTIGSKGVITSSEKTNLIATLKQEQKMVLRYRYTATAELIDYITSPNNKPTQVLTADEQEYAAEYRKAAALRATAWNPNETKLNFYTSYKIALSNVDLACGTNPATSTLSLNFDLKDTDADNYVGKMLYTTGYGTFDTLSSKRCVIEDMIQGL